MFIICLNHTIHTDIYYYFSVSNTKVLVVCIHTVPFWLLSSLEYLENFFSGTDI